MPLTRDIKNEIDEYLAKHATKREHADPIISAVTEIVNSKFQEIINILKQDIQDLKQEIVTLKGSKEELEVVKKEIETSRRENQKLVEMLNEKTDSLEQYTRRNSLRVFGVQETKQEDCEKKVLRVLKDKLQLDVLPEQIERCHRAGRFSENKPRSIIVKFISYKDRETVFKSKRLLKNTGIVIAEDLTINRLSLLRQARDAYGDKYGVWSKDGRIIIKTEHKTHRIENRKQLLELSQ